MEDTGVRLQASPSGRTVVVRPSGEQDLSTASALSAALDAAYGSPARVVVVDLQDVHFVEVTAFRALLAAHRDLERAGRGFAVVNVRPDVSRALALLDPRRELRLVRLERLFSPAWAEAGALQPPVEQLPV